MAAVAGDRSYGVADDHPAYASVIQSRQRATEGLQ
jgi:hypothetical protein